MSKISTKQILRYWETMRDAMFDVRIINSSAPSLLWWMSVNGYPKIFFNQGNLANLLGISRQSVNKGMLLLERFGYVEIQRPPVGNNKKPLVVNLKERYKAPTKLIVGMGSSCKGSLQVMSEKLTGDKTKVVPVLSEKLTHNGENGNNLISPERDSSSSNPQEIPTETSLLNQAPPTIDYSGNKDVQSILTIVKERHPALEWNQWELAGLASKLAEFGLERVETNTRKFLNNHHWKSAVTKMFLPNNTIWNDVESSKVSWGAGIVESEWEPDQEIKSDPLPWD